ncbi:DNA-binding protein [Sulfitobacter sp.]|uniref:DNA-binding protein n=1 Tax=Sulfitobacter sp. TaxID=1903071 RepID=UPI0030028072
MMKCLPMPVTRDFPPRLMPAPQAAHYLGVSESTLRTTSIPRKPMGSKRVYDRYDLDAYADSLPYEGKSEENTCDKVFED